jgi:hypothetical protein
VINIGGSYQRNFGERLFLDGSLFWVNTAPQNQFQASSSSLGYSLALNYRPSPRYGLTVNGSSNSTASPSNNALYSTSRSFGAQFTYRFTPAFNLGLSALTSYQNYSGAALNFPDQLKSDRVNNYRASLGWTAPNNHLKATLYIAQQNQNGTATPGSTFPDRFDFKNTIAGLALSYTI